MKKILLVLSLLGLSFSAAQACEPCGEIKILPTQNLELYPHQKSKTVEVLIYNPEYCYSNITDITLSDSENFDLNRSYGDVPCGDASTVSMRGYQYCTVGLTFKPTTNSGAFTTDIQVTDRDTGLHTASVDGKINSYCKILKQFHKRKSCASSTNKEVNYLANLNLIRPVPSTHVYVADNTLVFDEYYEANEGLATIALDDTVDFLSRLTFDVNQTAGLFMPRLAGDNGSYYTNDLRKTNRYGFMFPGTKAMTELNFTTWNVGFTGVVSNLSLVKISDLNQSSVQESAVEKCKWREHKSCGNFMKNWKDKCRVDYKKVVRKVCDRDHHERKSHKSCDRDHHEHKSNKSCDRDHHEHKSHKSCDRDHDEHKSHKSCDRDHHEHKSHKSCDRD